MDNVIVCPPTYGMYEVSANINAVAVKRVDLLADTFQLNVNEILKAIDENTKLIFICNPNNPTGNSFKQSDINLIIESFKGIVIIDEAYINYSASKSYIAELSKYPNIIVSQTLSKAWGLASLRVGMAFASEAIISLFNKVKPPYNVNQCSQSLALKALKNIIQVEAWVKETISEREKLIGEISNLSIVEKIFETDANFVLVKVNDANKIYSYLTTKNIIVRNRTNVQLCEGCLRITIGTIEENELVINALKNY